MTGWAAAATAGSAIKDIASGIGSIGGLFKSGGSSARKAAAQQYKYNLALQKQAQQWNEYMYRNRFQMQSEDLESAGINKLYGLQSAPSVTSGQGSVGMPDMVGEKNGKIQQILGTLGLATDWSAKKAMIAKTEAETRTENVNTDLRTVQTCTEIINYIKSKKDLEYQDERIITELEEKRSNIIKNLSSAKLNEAEAGTAVKLGNNYDAQTRKTKTETDILSPEATKNKSLEEYYKKHPKVKAIVNGASEAGKAFGAIVAGAGIGFGTAKMGAKTMGTAIKQAERANNAKKLENKFHKAMKKK